MEIPKGSSIEDVTIRRNIISKSYYEWKEKNPLQRKYNLSLMEFIDIRFVSITETCAYASKSYLSTLAVLQLDAILTNAIMVKIIPTKNTANQKPFEKMILMEYECPGIGIVKMSVGVRRGNHEKIQYCIIAMKV